MEKYRFLYLERSHCRYRFQRGANRGKQCRYPAVLGYSYCSSCMNKKVCRYSLEEIGIRYPPDNEDEISVIHHPTQSELYITMRDPRFVIDGKSMSVTGIYVTNDETRPLTDQEVIEACKLGFKI